VNPGVALRLIFLGRDYSGQMEDAINSRDGALTNYRIPHIFERRSSDVEMAQLRPRDKSARDKWRPTNPLDPVRRIFMNRTRATWQPQQRNRKEAWFASWDILAGLFIGRSPNNFSRECLPQRGTHAI
jgi:hypothetical protein